MCIPYTSLTNLGQAVCWLVGLSSAVALGQGGFRKTHVLALRGADGPSQQFSN